VIALLQIVLRLLADLVAMAALAFRPQRAFAAEILVFRRQMALSLYKKHGTRSRRFDVATRIDLALLPRLCVCRSWLTIVRSEAVIGWRRACWRLCWRLCWRYKSRPSRLRIAVELRQLIRRMVSENSVGGEARIASGLLLNLRRAMRRTRLNIISDFLNVNGYRFH